MRRSGTLSSTPSHPLLNILSHLPFLKQYIFFSLTLSLSQFLQESIIPLYCFCKDANERVSINSTQHGNHSYQNNTALSSSYKHQEDPIDIGIPIGEENCALLKEERVPLLLMGFMPNLFEVNFIRLFCFYVIFSLLPIYVSP